MFEVIVVSLLLYLCSGIKFKIGRQIDGVYFYVIYETYYWCSDLWRKVTKSYKIYHIEPGNPPY